MPRHDISEWLTGNELKGFPFKEDAGRLITLLGTPVSSIPTGVLIDLAITTPYVLFKETIPGSLTEHIPPLFKLSSILRTAGDVKFTFSEKFVGSIPETGIAEVTVPVGPLFRERGAYPVTGLVSGTHGVAVFGREFLRYFSSLGLGTYLLDDSNGYLQERTVRDNPFARVTSISEFGNTAEILIGDVKLEEGFNVSLVPVPASNGIRIDAIPGAGLGYYCGQGCAATFPPTVLIPNSDVWKYKVYKEGDGVPAPTASFYHAVGAFIRGAAPLDYFLESFDDEDWAMDSMPFKRGMGSSQPPTGLHVFEESTEIVARREVILPDSVAGLAVLLTLGWDDYVEAYWNEIPVTALINSGAAALCVPFASAEAGG